MDLQRQHLCSRVSTCIVACAGRWKGALVAIKVVEHSLEGNADVIEAARESLLAASVSHPNVVSVPPVVLFRLRI